MRNRLRKFPVALVGIAILIGGVIVGLRYLGESHSRRLLLTRYDAPASSDSDPAVGDPSLVDDAQPTPGEELLSESARRILELPSLECKIRQQVSMFGQEFSGVGSYKQLSPNDIQRIRVRWELKFQVGTEEASLQQVNDGRFFWTRRDLPGAQSLSRVDLRTVRDVIRREPDLAPEAILHSWIALGGLTRLVHGLNENFQFGLAHPRMVDSTPVWVLAGVWRRDVLSAIVPPLEPLLKQNKAVSLEQFPAHLPDLVVVVLSRDPRLPAFPYRIEYRRSREGHVRGTSATDDPAEESLADFLPLESLRKTQELAVLDLYEVNLESALTPEDFLFQPPASQQAADETEQFLLRTFAPTASTPSAESAPPSQPADP